MEGEEEEDNGEENEVMEDEEDNAIEMEQANEKITKEAVQEVKQNKP